MRYLLALLFSLSVMSIAGCACSPRNTDCNPYVDEVARDEFFVDGARRELIRLITVYFTELKLNKCFNLEHAFVEKDPFGYKIWIDFTAQDILDIEGARRLFVGFVQNLLERLNGDPILAAQTEGHHFTIADLYISVEFESFFGKYVDVLYVARMQLECGVMTSYYAHDALNHDSVTYHKHYEPYETSLLIVQTEQELMVNSKQVEEETKRAERQRRADIRAKRIELELEAKERASKRHRKRAPGQPMQQTYVPRPQTVSVPVPVIPRQTNTVPVTTTLTPFPAPLPVVTTPVTPVTPIAPVTAVPTTPVTTTYYEKPAANTTPSGTVVYPQTQNQTLVPTTPY